MIISIIGFIFGLYVFARKSIKNEPLKGYTDKVFNNINNWLNTYKDKKALLVFDSLYKLSEKGLIISLGLMFIFILLPQRFSHTLILFFLPIFLLSLFLYFSISWIQEHNKTFKEYFLNFHMLLFLFSPSILYFLCKNADVGISSPVSLQLLYEHYNIFYIQFFWILLVFGITYIGVLIIALTAIV